MSEYKMNCVLSNTARVCVCVCLCAGASLCVRSWYRSYTCETTYFPSRGHKHTSSHLHLVLFWQNTLPDCRLLFWSVPLYKQTWKIHLAQACVLHFFCAAEWMAKTNDSLEKQMLCWKPSTLRKASANV